MMSFGFTKRTATWYLILKHEPSAHPPDAVNEIFFEPALTAWRKNSLMYSLCVTAQASTAALSAVESVTSAEAGHGSVSVAGPFSEESVAFDVVSVPYRPPPLS